MTIAAAKSDRPPLSEAEFIAGFQAIGEERYHHKHPFHLLMHEGKLTRGQLQAWALNRYFYQSRIPIKDAAILARSEDPAFRLAWRKRILDHDGDGTNFALAWVVKHADTREQQDQAHAALRAKCDILWAQLDALHFAYVNPGWPPPGAFVPENGG